MINQIEKFLLEGQIEKALKILLNSQKKETVLKKELILQSARYNIINRQISNGIISFEQAQLIQNQIIYSLLEIIKRHRIKKKITIDDFARTKILFLSASPNDENILRLNKEIRQIEMELENSDTMNNFNLMQKNAVSIKDVHNYILRYKPNIVHFSGHRNDTGILLGSDQKHEDIASNEKLSSLFQFFCKQISCVFFNSCYSISQAKQIKVHIPYVIGMKSSISDQTAIAFSSKFYKAISLGNPIEYAFEYAKLTLNLADFKDFEIPELLS